MSTEKMRSLVAKHADLETKLEQRWLIILSTNFILIV